MSPRNTPCMPARLNRWRRFNQAAGCPRGIPFHFATWVTTMTTASIRPRVVPAEYTPSGTGRSAVASTLQSGRGLSPRNTSPPTCTAPSRSRSFNQAAGCPRGIRTARKPFSTQGLPLVFRAVARVRRARRSAESRTGHRRRCNSSILNDLPACEHSLGIRTAPNRSRRRGGSHHTMTGSRRTAWNVLPKLTTRGSTPSATPMSTNTTWSSV